MSNKEPVLLVVMVETERRRWLTAGVSLSGQTSPLQRSDEGDLDAYLPLQFDEQVSFLRHRFAGVLQRAVDRLWNRQQKPCQVVFLFDGELQAQPHSLAQRVGEHFTEWMTRPPVAAFMALDGFHDGQTNKLRRLSGTMDEHLHSILNASLQPLAAAVRDDQAWETSPQRVSTWRHE